MIDGDGSEEVTEDSPVTVATNTYLENRLKISDTYSATFLLELGVDLQEKVEEVEVMIRPLATLAKKLGIDPFPQTFDEMAALRLDEASSVAQQLFQITGKSITREDMELLSLKAKEIRKAIRLQGENEVNDKSAAK